MKNDTTYIRGDGNSLSDCYLSIYLPRSPSHISTGIRINCGLNHECVYGYKERTHICPYTIYFLRKNQKVTVKEEFIYKHIALDPILIFLSFHVCICIHLYKVLYKVSLFLGLNIHVLSVLLNTSGRARWGWCGGVICSKCGLKEVILSTQREMKNNNKTN